MSAFYNRPWAPGYALPGYVKKEDALTRGSAVTTKWLPRGTISSVPPGLNHGGYVVPQYVLDEPVGSQAYTTPWIPRGTVSSMKSLKTGLPWHPNAHTLDSNGLGSLGATEKSDSSVGGADPIEAYGKKASAVITQDLKELPAARREGELRKLLNQIDSKLHSEYKKQKAHLQRLNVPAAEAEVKGLAIALSQGMNKEFMKLGEKAKKAKARGRKVDIPKPGLRKGQVPLAALTGFDAQANNYYGSLGIDIKGFSLKDTLSKIGGFACDVATHPLTPLAAGATGAATGGPVAASTATAGAGVAAAACSQGSGFPGGSFAPAPATPSWVLPAIIGGGVLALVLVLKD
jgi:hypothetical protein